MPHTDDDDRRSDDIERRNLAAGGPPGFPSPPRDPISMAFIYGLGAAVTLAWLASVFADIIVKNYSTPVALHGLMGTVVGSVFADVSLRRARRRILDEADTRARQEIDAERRNT